MWGCLIVFYYGLGGLFVRDCCAGFWVCVLLRLFEGVLGYGRGLFCWIGKVLLGSLGLCGTNVYLGFGLLGFLSCVVFLLC